MKCSNCGGTGVIHVRNIHVLCGKCQGIGFIDEPKPKKQMTEQEYLQTCTTEQLAEMLANESENVINDFENFDFKREHKEFWEMWLKQPHTDKGYKE